MSEPNEAIEVTAASVDEAIKQALDQLGASEDDVVIQVLSTPRSGVLGLGARQARVRVERRAPRRRAKRRDVPAARTAAICPGSSAADASPAAPPPRPRAEQRDRDPNRDRSNRRSGSRPKPRP